MIHVNSAGFCDDQLPLLSTIGRGPAGPQGEVITPTFADPIEWDVTSDYDKFTVVLHGGNSYTSIRDVVAGTDIHDGDYWALTGNYDAQVEQYHQDVEQLSGQVETFQDSIDAVSEVIPAEDFDSTNTVKKYVDDKFDSLPDFDLIELAEISSEEQGMYVAPELSGSAYNPVLTLDNGILRTKVSGSLGGFIASGNQDICEAATLAGSYLKNHSSLYYGNAYCALIYSPWDNPTEQDPKEHILNGKMQIDCSTFAMLVGHGIPFIDSTYNTGVVESKANHWMYDPTHPLCKAYWKYNSAHDGNFDPTDLGYGRLLSDAFAKMLYDSGRLSVVRKNDPNGIPIGAICFCGHGEGRFMGITHCYVPVGFIGFGVSKMIIAEASDDGVNCRTLDANVYDRDNTVAYYMPPYFGGMYAGASGANSVKYTYTYQNIQLDTAKTFNYLMASSHAARVATIVPQDSGGHSITIEATNAIDNTTISNTITIYGHYTVILPCCYETISVSASDTSTYNLCFQVCTSDKQIYIPSR